MGAERRRPRSAQLRNRKLKQEKRRAIGPLQVVDDQHKRLVVGRGLEERRDRVEQPKACLLGFEFGRQGQPGPAARASDTTCAMSTATECGFSEEMRPRGYMLGAGVSE